MFDLVFVDWLWVWFAWSLCLLCFAYVSVILILRLLVGCCDCFVCYNPALLVVFCLIVLLFVLRLVNHYFAVYFAYLKAFYCGFGDVLWIVTCDCVCLFLCLAFRVW